MFKDDSIYQVLLRYNFDLFRGEDNISDYMETHCNKYYRDITKAIEDKNGFLSEDFINLLKGEMSTLGGVVEEIPNILKAYDMGLFQAAYEKSANLFTKMVPYFITRCAWRKNNGLYYRLRLGDYRIKEGMDSKNQKKELFHIRKAMRNKIGAYRYSVAGYPCLYLASDRELAWFECGMPKQFSYCQMSVDVNGEEGLHLIDLSFRPVEVLSSVSTWILNERRSGGTDAEDIYKFLIKYILMYPISAACSVKVKDRNSKFVEEYIFPQLIMQWVRESKEYDGVRYKSSLNTDLVLGMGAVNIALPVKEFRDDGLDKRLASYIAISDIGYLDVSDDYKKYQSVLDEITNFKNELKMYIVEAPFYGNYMSELIEMCESVVKTYRALIEGNYTNSELILIQLNILCEHARLLYSNREEKIEECIKEAHQFEKAKINVEDIKNQFEKFHFLMDQVLDKNSVFGFNFEIMENYEKI